MIKRIVAAAVAALFLGALSATPAATQATQPAQKQAPAAKKKPAKKASPKQEAQRQKMRDCATQWKASGQKGRSKHRAFMKECLKS
jgi:Ni/Co efflux regulator RcnB